MWKFKVSKFKNAAPTVLKKEDWINDISANNLMQSHGNHICASSVYLVFNTDVSGVGNLGILPVDTKGRHGPGSIKLIRAHSEYVTNFDFSPLDDLLLATSSQDQTVCVWRLPESLTEDVCQAAWTLPVFDKRVELVSWHPTAEDVLALSSANTVKIFNVAHQREMYDLSMHGDLVQSLSWKGDGSLLVTSCKDKILRVLDPRAQNVSQETSGHGGNKDSRVLWLGDKDYILSTGFDTMRQREIVLRDVRQFGSSLKHISVDSSSGTLMPLFDPGTNMTFVAGKGDSKVMYFELTENSPYLSQASVDSVEQIKGVCMLPKRAANVMECEVNKLFVLSKQAIVPMPYVVPRKCHTDFHEDLFPETFSGEPAMSAQQWSEGLNTKGTKVSLNPSKKPAKRVLGKEDQVSRGGVCETSSEPTGAKPDDRNEARLTSSVQEEIAKNKPWDTQARDQKPNSNAELNSVVASSEPKPIHSAILREKKQHKAFSGVRQSKFRHLKGTPEHRSKHIDNVKNLSRTIPGESDLFQANTTFCAVPIAGPGGCIQILKTSEPGRLPETGIPVIQNGSSVTDFVFDPFNDHRLVVACDDAKIRVWDIPEGGLTESLVDPALILHGHTEKLYFVRFHPLASDVLASGSYDMTVRLWNLSTGEESLQLEGHTDTIFSFAWSPDGKYCATACKDGQLRIYEPRCSSQPIKTGEGPEGSRGARVIWVCGMKYIAVSGFEKGSGRSVTIYSADDLASKFTTVLDNSPSILMAFYDEDSSTLFLTGRGDSLVQAFEISEEYPHIFALSGYTSSALHQSIAFLPKRQVDVKQVEFAKALRLTKNSIEPVSFTVPRIKNEFFQDDLFPDTKVTWEATMTRVEWFSGEDRPARTISLKPTDMQNLSQAPVTAPKPKKFESFNDYANKMKTDEEKKEELLVAMNDKMRHEGDYIPQDDMEGVDSDEWED